MNKYEIEVGSKTITFERKGWAQKSNGEVLVKSGNTEVLVTAVMSQEDTDRDYFPLMVFYEEKFYARKEILGSRFTRREGRPSANATLISRAIDRTIRPLFPDGLKREIEVIATCLSWDGEVDPDVLTMLGASFALHISDIPWNGPLGALRIDDNFVLNPSYEEREESESEIMLCGLEKGLVNMIEMEGKEASKEFILEAHDKAAEAIDQMVKLQEKARKEIGREKLEFEKKKDPEVEKKVKKLVGNRIEEALYNTEGSNLEINKKLGELKREILSSFEEEGVDAVFEKQVKKLIQEKGLEGKRIGGRGMDEVREIKAETNPVSATHGSGLFSRGLTTCLSVVTLGGPDDRKLIDGMEVSGKKRFLHHYNFPPYSVGDVRPLRGPGRREIGHGSLGEKAIKSILPSFEEFPYTIRIVSEILTSNGSSSMAAVCGSSLALMDAGVEIKPVAGIAMGIVKDGDDYQILTDIQGPEDLHGGMDLKVAGTRDGINAIQMDVKIDGLSKKMLEEALDRAEKARIGILDVMEKQESRKELKSSIPSVFKTRVPESKIGKVIGSGGKTIKKIMEETETNISIEDSGEVFITSTNREGAKRALATVEQIGKELKKGQTFNGTVVKSMRFGVIVDLCPGKDGLLHKSKYDKKPKKGDKIKVKVEKVDPSGKVDLSLIK